MSGVISLNLKKNDASISNRFPGVHKRGIHTHRQTDTHTHDDSIRRNAMRCISPKKDCNLNNKNDLKLVFFWRYYSFKSIIYIRSHCQSFFQRMIIAELCWRQWGNLRSDGNDHKNAIEHLRPEAWRKALRHGIFASIRIWKRHKKELAGVVL